MEKKEPVHEVGEEFEGTCIMCKQEGNVAFLLIWHKLLMVNDKKGPYDRLCAYKLKFGTLDNFKQMPENKFELLYRLILRDDFPEDRDQVVPMLFRLVIVGVISVMVTLLLIFGTYYSLDYIPNTIEYKGFIWGYLRFSLFFFEIILIPSSVYVSVALIKIKDIKAGNKTTLLALSNKEFMKQIPIIFFSMLGLNLIWLILMPLIFWPLFFGLILMWELGFGYVLNLIPILIFLLLLSRETYRTLFRIAKRSPLLLYGKLGSGRNHIDNFELFWNGKINDREESQNYYYWLRVIILSYVLITVSILWMIPNFDLYVRMTNSIDHYLVFDNVYKFLGINRHLLIQILYFSIIFEFIYIVFQGLTMNVGTSMYPKDIHQEVLNRKDDGRIEIDRKSRVSRILDRMGLKGSRGSPICSICRLDISPETNSVGCPSCLSRFHRKHMEMYLQNKSNRLMNCPVCQYELKLEII